MSFGVTLDMGGLDDLPEIFARKTQEALLRTLETAEGYAADLAHIQTGAMRAGLYISTAEGSTYEAAVAAARALSPTVEILPEVPRPEPGRGILADCTAQGVFEEFGTSKRAPHPFLGPAAMQAEPVFRERLEDVGRSL